MIGTSVRKNSNKTYPSPSISSDATGKLYNGKERNKLFFHLDLSFYVMARLIPHTVQHIFSFPANA